MESKQCKKEVVNSRVFQQGILMEVERGGGPLLVISLLALSCLGAMPM